MLRSKAVWTWIDAVEMLAIRRPDSTIEGPEPKLAEFYLTRLSTAFHRRAEWFRTLVVGDVPAGYLGDYA